MNTYYWKPCPFCGSSAILKRKPLEGYNGEYKFSMECCAPDCLATIPTATETTLHQSEEEAKAKVIQKWNHREHFKQPNSELFDMYVLGVLDAARQAITKRYNKDFEEENNDYR